MFLLIGLFCPVFTEQLGAQVLTGVVAADERVFLIATRVQTFLLRVRAVSLSRWRLARLCFNIPRPDLDMRTARYGYVLTIVNIGGAVTFPSVLDVGLLAVPLGALVFVLLLAS